MAKKSTHKRVNPPRGEVTNPVQQAIPRGGLLDQLSMIQAGLVAPRQGQYLDLTGFDDYQASLDFVLETKRRFQALPSGLRRDCMNDPRQFLRLAAQAAEGDEVAQAQFRRHGLQVSPGRPNHVSSRPPERTARKEPVQQDLVDQAGGTPPA